MIARLFTGFVLGAALTALGLWLAPAPGASETPTTTTTTPLDDTVWVEPGEVRFGNSVLIGRDLYLEGSRLRLEYDVVPLTAAYDRSDDHDVPTAVPASFRAILDTGDVVDTPLLSPSAGSVAFEVPDGVTADDVETIRLTEWRIRVPVDVEVRMPSVKGASVTLPDGSLIILDTILEQSNGTILQFDYENPPGAWPQARRSFMATPDFAGLGDGWRLASATMGLSRGFQLTWDGPEAPPEIALRVRIAPWQPVESDLDVPLPEAQE